MKTLYISIRRAVIRDNKKNHTNNPPIEVRQFKGDSNPSRVHSVEFTGVNTRVVYDPNSTIGNGVHVWVEVDEPDASPAPVEVTQP